MTDDNVRLVTLGGIGVGKSCILKRFLLKTYTDKYRATVEDLHNREYNLGEISLKVDILDTSGDMQFPAMRRLSIATAHAFLLVYATTSSASFCCVKQCIEEIREQRSDYRDIPIVIAGNKLDLAQKHREVKFEELSDWVYCELPTLRIKILECSAKDNVNITEIFKSLLSLSKYFQKISSTSTEPILKRRSSTYISVTSRAKSRITSKSNEKQQTILDSDPVALDECKIKPRSKSLNRKSIRKSKHKNHNTVEDCSVQ